MAAAVVLRKVPFRVLLFKRLIFRRELRFPDREEEHGDGDEHNGRHNDKQRLIVHMIQTGGLGVGIEHRRNAEIQNAADRAHQIDDGVRTRAQRLWRHVGHEGDGGSAVRSHVALTSFLERHPEIRRVTLYMDHDLAGFVNARKIKTMLHEDKRFRHIRVSVNPPRMGKDYNEKLLQVREQLQTSQHQCRPKEAAVSI